MLGLGQSRMVRSGSSYLSQSEFPLTFGLGRDGHVQSALIEWPSGRTEELKNLAAGNRYQCIEGRGIVKKIAFAK